MRLDGKLSVVTGAASGIGLATAEAFIAAGSHVILADIAAEKGEQEANRLSKGGGKADFVHLDVTSDDSIALFAQKAKVIGPIEIIVNAAGWGKIGFFLENDEAFWNRVINLNFVGPMKLVRALLPEMMERKSGRIINVSSDAARVGSLGETVYSGAKSGLLGFTKALAREMARYSINVNAVCPGPTDTPLLNAVPEKHREAFRNAIPMKRFGKPSECADAILFFACSRSSYITGQVLSVNGGLTMVG